MIENVRLKKAGATWWHTKDGYSPSLSKSNLGTFFHAILTKDVQVGSIWVFNHKYPCSGVYVSIFMTEETKNEIEADTKYRFRPPQKVNLN